MTKLSDVILRDITANRPAAAIAGRLFFDTTLVKLQRDNGAGWDDVAEAGGGGSALEVTDGTHDLTPVTKVTVTDLLVGGTAGASTLKPSLSNANAQLAADVSMTNAGQYYDGPSVSLAAGTWFIVGILNGNHNASTGWFSAKLWDGTTAYAASEHFGNVAGESHCHALVGIVSPTGTTTYKLSGAGSVSGYKIKAALGNNSPGNLATSICAVRIA